MNGGRCRAVFGDCWCTRGQGHNEKVGEISCLRFHFLVKRIKQSHDVCFFLDSGLCRAFLSFLCGKRRESEFVLAPGGTRVKLTRAFWQEDDNGKDDGDK
jgi:hypothetical protein